MGEPIWISSKAYKAGLDYRKLEYLTEQSTEIVTEDVGAEGGVLRPPSTSTRTSFTPFSIVIRYMFVTKTDIDTDTDTDIDTYQILGFWFQTRVNKSDYICGLFVVDRKNVDWNNKEKTANYKNGPKPQIGTKAAEKTLETKIAKRNNAEGPFLHIPHSHENLQVFSTQLFGKEHVVHAPEDRYATGKQMTTRTRTNGATVAPIASPYLAQTDCAKYLDVVNVVPEACWVQNNQLHFAAAILVNWDRNIIYFLVGKNVLAKKFGSYTFHRDINLWIFLLRQLAEEFLQLCLKNIFKNHCVTLFQNLRASFIRVKYRNYLILKRDYSRVSNVIIARGLSTQKNPHLTKLTSKLPVPNAMGQKRSKNKC
ncbi:hypothetical protein LXL04_001482 [Taraxacum kok-saghyz]